MKKITVVFVALICLATQLNAQIEPNAGKWKTWFIASGKDYRLPAPASYKTEVAEVLLAQQNLDATTQQQILYWNAGSPGYRWHDMMSRLWTVDTGRYGVLANMLLGTAIYDATVAAWDTKYAFNRPRPFVADKRIQALVPKMESPGYPCEHAVAAGVAVTVFSRFYPHLSDSVHRMAQRAMASRIAAGVAFPSDTRAGFELGKQVALKAIEQTRHYITQAQWDGKIPVGPQYWRGKYAMHPVAGKNKTVVLDSSSQFRPGPPPDFAQDMEELKAFKPTFRSQANAFYFASQNATDLLMNQKIFEYNLHLNPPRAARIAMMGGLVADMLSHFFPADAPQFQKMAKDGAESRFQGGIHFRTDNEVGLELGRKIAGVIVQRVSGDGADALQAIAQKKN